MPKQQRRVEVDDMQSAHRGLAMAHKTPEQLRALSLQHAVKPAFASRVIAAAAKQAYLAKLASVPLRFVRPE